MDTSGKKTVNRVYGEGIELDPDVDIEWDPDEWILWCNKNKSTLKIKGNGKEKSNKEGSRRGCTSTK